MMKSKKDILYRRNLTHFVIFSFLFFLSFANLNAKSKYVLSPVEGDWANYQSLVIDVPEDAVAAYSFTDADPLYAGFIYDAPVLLELEGDVELKIAIKNKDDTVIEETVKYSVKKNPVLPPLFESVSTKALISLSADSDFSIPNSMRFCFGDDKTPFLKGRQLAISKTNSLEQIIPLRIDNNNVNYRFMVHLLPLEPDNTEQKENNLISDASVDESNYEIRRIEKPLSQCPFTVRFEDWSALSISTADDMFVSIDDGVWQTGTFTVNLDRSVIHTVSWLDTTGSSTEEFIPEMFKVYYANIPVKPDLILTQEGKSKPLKIELDSLLYRMELVQNQKGVLHNKKFFGNNFEIDTVFGNYINDKITTKIYYDNIYQGELIADLLIDKEPPVVPELISSEESVYSRKKVNLEFLSAEEVYWDVRELEVDNIDPKNLEIGSSVLTNSNISDAVLLKNKTASISNKKLNPVYYNIIYFAKDDAGNISEPGLYQVVIDLYNYFVDGSVKELTYVPDGTPVRPFNSLSQLNDLMNSDDFVRFHLAGNFENVSQLNINNNCEFFSKAGSRISFKENEGINVTEGSVKIENCILEQSQNFSDDEILQQNLFVLNNAQLDLSNCEVVSIYKNNGSIIYGNNSKVNIFKSGVTIQSSRFASVVNLLNSSFNCDSSRLAIVATNCVAISMNNGNLNLTNSQIQINGEKSRFYDLFGVDYSIVDNKFLYKTFSEKLESADIFSIKSNYSNNVLKKF